MTDSDPSGMKAWAGRHVELELKYDTGEVERLSLEIVQDAAADFEKGFLGETTPLGKAIYGRTAGSVIAYRAGDIVEVRLLAVTGPVNQQEGDRAAEREKNIRKAVADSDRTNAINFASSTNSKWGDYDPDGIKDDWE